MVNQCTTPNCKSEIPSGSKMDLLHYIYEVSFAAYDALLFLDTHPGDPNAMHYYSEFNHKRDMAIREYGRIYGPLTARQISESGCSCSDWINQPWPWEGGKY